MSNRFMQVLLPLFELVGSDLGSLQPASSYVFTLREGLNVEIKESPNDFLTISCVISLPIERFEDQETLGILLQTNLLGLEHPPILTGAIIDQKKIILWTREALILLDREAMVRLFRKFTEQAQKTAKWLALPVDAIRMSKPGSNNQQTRLPRQTDIRSKINSDMRS